MEVINRMWYLESPGTDPYFNLALEEYMFCRLNEQDSLFMLWQNRNTIVVGRYQNTIQEINQAFVEEHGIQVVRRMTGGGAVYHDLGNLNFTFITSVDKRRGIEFRAFCKPVIATLSLLGVNAEITGRNDMTIGGKKFSGNSQYIRGGRVLHHGTILFHSDLSVVTRALNVNGDKIISKGIKSISSRVTNIADHLERKISLEQFKEQLLNTVSIGQSLTSYKLEQRDIDAVTQLREDKYRTWEWNYGHSPKYEIQKCCRIEGCGSVEISMAVEKGGKIGGLQFFGDFFGQEDCAGLAARLIGLPCRYGDLVQVLRQENVERYIHGATAEQIAGILTD